MPIFSAEPAIRLHPGEGRGPGATTPDAADAARCSPILGPGRRRGGAWFGLIAIAACHRQPTAALAPRPTPAAAPILCAIGGGPLTPRCTAELISDGGGTRLVIREPNGGFRRFDVTQDGTGLVATDGAANAKVTPVGADTIEVAVDGDRYRLPATVKGR